MGMLRFILALSVAWTHAGLPKGLSGDLCVTIFFAISGFYMSLVLSEKRAYDRPATFYKQRVLRLFPAYWVLLLISVVLGVWTAPDQGWRFALSQNLPDDHPVLSVAWVLSQLLIVGQDAFLFLGLDSSQLVHFQPAMAAAANTPLAPLNIIPPAWSLALELLFYLLAPFLVRWSSKALAALMLLSVAIRLALAYGVGYVSDPWATRFFPSELCYFLVGMLGYRWVIHADAPGRGRGGLLYLAACAISVGSLAANRFGHVNAGLISPAAAATFLLTVAIPWLFARTRSTRWDRAIGEYSYPLYLCHVLVFELFELLHWHSRLSGYVMVLCAVAFAIVLARAVDKPIDQYRHRLLKASR